MGILYVVGLGPGDPGQITTETWKLLEKGYPVYLRTKVHPSVAALEERKIPFKTFDYLYNKMNDFESLYETIVENLLALQQKEDLVYVVPGSPMVAERTVRLLLEKAEKNTVKIIPGMSFLEVLYTTVGLDPIEGLYITDGKDLASMYEVPKAHMIVTQVYSQAVASDVKLSLMNFYEDEAEVTVIHHLSLPDETMETIPLYELDRLPYVDYLTSLWIPKEALRIAPEEVEDRRLEDTQTDTSAQTAVQGTSVQPLLDVMAALRGPGGCPWDKKQDHRSLRRYLIEETYEVLQAIDRGDAENLCEELGDVLLQIAFHARIAQEEGLFTMEDIVTGITEKMIRRHPHVFGDVSLQDAEAVAVRWEEIKAKEKGKKPSSVMDGIPKELPTLLKAQKIQEKATKVGFVWDSVDGVWDKIAEEIEEFKEAVAKKNTLEMEKEAGDILFSLISLFEWYKISGENALRGTNEKFLRRFSYVEEAVKASGRPWNDFTLEELDSLWITVKKQEKD